MNDELAMESLGIEDEIVGVQFVLGRAINVVDEMIATNEIVELHDLRELLSSMLNTAESIPETEPWKSLWDHGHILLDERWERDIESLAEIMDEREEWEDDDEEIEIDN